MIARLQSYYRLDRLSRYQRSREVLFTAGDLARPVDGSVLRTYHPEAHGHSIVGTRNVAGISLNQIFRANPLLSNQRWYRSTMVETHDRLTESFSRNAGPSEAANSDLHPFLEESLDTLSSNKTSPHRYALTYQRFLCLAHIAKMDSSGLLRGVLSQFFARHGGEIIERENEMAVFNWCRLIVSSLKGSERVACLREIIVNRDDVLADLFEVYRIQPSQQIRVLMHVVKDIVDRIEDQESSFGHGEDFEEFHDRGRSLRRSHFPSMHDHSDAPQRCRISSAVNLKRDNIPHTPELMAYDYGDHEFRRHTHRNASRQDEVRANTRRAQSSDHHRLKELEHRMREAEKAVTYVAQQQVDERTGRTSSRGPWSRTGKESLWDFSQVMH